MGSPTTGLAVTLTEDLTRYDSRLVAGSTGTTTGRLSPLGDRFAPVRFDNGAALDVLWQGLDITDEEYLAVKAAEAATFDEDLRTTRKAVWYQGPRGGFYGFDIEYEGPKGIVYRSFAKDEGLSVRAKLEGYGIKVEVSVV